MIDRQRKLNRWKDYDYSQDGGYFIIICIKDKMCLLGEVENHKMIFNQYGEIIKEIWNNIPYHYENIILDEYVIMPNHIHGIIIIIENNPVGTEHRSVQISGQSIVGTEHRSVPHCSVPNEANPRNYGLVSKIVKSFKETCVKTIRSRFDDFTFAFQRSFYDHIIHNEKSLNAIRQYIVENPLKWDINEDNPINWISKTPQM